MSPDLRSAIHSAAPEPRGPFDETSVAKRARHIGRMRLLAVGSVLVAIVAAVPALSAVVGDQEETLPVGPSPSPGSECPAQPPPSLADIDDPFRPPDRYTEGSPSEVLPLVFPDGSTAELVYPADLRLESMNPRPDTTGGAPGGVIRPQITHGGVGFRVEGPVRCIEGSDGTLAPVWRWKDREDLVVLRFGDWYVSVFEKPADLELWVDRLKGEIRGGWLVLDGGGRLVVGPEQNPADSQIRFSDETNILSIWPLDCASREGIHEEGRVVELGGDSGDFFTSFCIDDVEIHAQGRSAFVSAVAENVRVRNLETRFPLDHYAIVP